MEFKQVAYDKWEHVENKSRTNVRMTTMFGFVLEFPLHDWMVHYNSVLPVTFYNGVIPLQRASAADNDRIFVFNWQTNKWYDESHVHEYKMNKHYTEFMSYIHNCHIQSLDRRLQALEHKLIGTHL